MWVALDVSPGESWVCEGSRGDGAESLKASHGSNDIVTTFSRPLYCSGA